MTKNERRLADYKAYQFLRERGRLPAKVQAKRKKKVRRRNREIEQDLRGAPRPPIPTPEEDRLAALFEWRGIKFQRQKCIRLAKKRREGIPLYAFVDFWLPDAEIAVEVDGWHHKGRDFALQDRNRTTKILNSAPWIKQVRRIWNSEVMQPSGALDDLIATALAARP